MTLKPGNLYYVDSTEAIEDIIFRYLFIGDIFSYAAGIVSNKQILFFVEEKLCFGIGLTEPKKYYTFISGSQKIHLLKIHTLKEIGK